MLKDLKAVLALFGTVMLLSGLLAWTMHVPQGTATGDIIYGQDSNYLTNLAPGTSGQVLKTLGAGSAPAWANAALATSAGSMIAAGRVTLGGANPTTTSTGLTSVASCVLSPQTATAPGDNYALITYTATTAVLKVYAWRNTSGTDPTLVAATDSATEIAWICQGT